MFGQILKSLGPKTLLSFLPMILTMIGNDLKNKDANDTGSDDAAGNILIAAAPAIDAFETGNGTSLRKSLVAVRTAIDNYLKQTDPAPAAHG